MTDALASLTSHYLTFSLGEDLYAVPIGTVREIRGSRVSDPLDEAASYIAGGFRYAGELLPAVDLRRRLGLPACAGSGPTVTVVVDASDRRLGVIADAVADVVDLGVHVNTLVSPHQSEARAGLAYLKGVAAMGERMVLILDLDQLVSPGDVAALDAALAAMPAAAGAA